MKHKKAQVSFEFVMIFSLALIMVAGFTYIINQRLSEISKEQEYLVMKNLANNIKSEVLLAASVNNNYLRRFEVPVKINSRDYTMDIEEDSLTIQTFEGSHKTNEYFTVFPVHVKGNFVEEIGYNNTEHCITKNNIDGIRIARNQISLDSERENGTYHKDEIIEVTVSLNCVKNIRSVQFTVKFDPSMLEIMKEKTVPITYSNRQLNPLFEEVDTLDYEGLNLITANYSYPYTAQGRYTFGVIGRNCATGSGNIAKIYFKVLADSGNTNINFEPAFGDKNLIVLDCTTNKYTKEDIPDSKKGTDIKITQ